MIPLRCYLQHLSSLSARRWLSVIQSVPLWIKPTICLEYTAILMHFFADSHQISSVIQTRVFSALEREPQMLQHQIDVFVFLLLVKLSKQFANVDPVHIKVSRSWFDFAVFELLCDKVANVKRTICDKCCGFGLK